MNVVRFIEKSLCTVLSVLILFTFCACSETAESRLSSNASETKTASFTKNNDENLVSPTGTEYSFLAAEYELHYLGDLIFQGSVEGEEKTSEYWGIPYQTGLFSIKGDEAMNILIRRHPDSEWNSIYRKSSLPQFDFSVDNCVRLELVSETENDAIHATCGDGIIDKSEIAEFLADIRSQKDPDKAGLYDLVTEPDGTYENCYSYAAIYGFFEDEPNLAVRMGITSYNDLAYSVSIEDKEYVLPEKWIHRLQKSH